MRCDHLWSICRGLGLMGSPVVERRLIGEGLDGMAASNEMDGVWLIVLPESIWEHCNELDTGQLVL